MGTIYASCGHPLDDAAVLDDHFYWWPAGDGGWSYGMLCTKCVLPYSGQAERPVAVGDSPRKASEMDVTGVCFGIRFEGDQVMLYVEDDENYFPKIVFHKLWLPDLLQTIAKAIIAGHK